MSKHSLRQIKGATMIEYVLIVGLIAIAAVAIISTLGTGIVGAFTKANSTLPT